MANIASQRIQRQFQKVMESVEVDRSLIAIELVNNWLLEVRDSITGRSDTTYDGVVFHLSIKGIDIQNIVSYLIQLVIRSNSSEDLFIQSIESVV